MARTKRNHRTREEIEDEAEVGEMSFQEIGVVLGIPAFEAKRIFIRAMKKLKHPDNARKLWDYKGISKGER